MQKDDSFSPQLEKAFRILKTNGFTFRLATMEEKRAVARKYKNGDYLPWSRIERQEISDVRNNFKKDVWAVFRGGFSGFWSSRMIVNNVRRFAAFRKKNKRWDIKGRKGKKGKFRNVVISMAISHDLIKATPALKNSEFYTGGTRKLRYTTHLCDNCAEVIGLKWWKENKKKMLDTPITSVTIAWENAVNNIQ